MRFNGKTMQSAEQAGRTLKRKFVPVVAEGTARSAELAADGATRAAAAMRHWADDVSGASRRRRMFMGLGLLIVLGAVLAFIMSSGGKRSVKKAGKSAKSALARVS